MFRYKQYNIKKIKKMYLQKNQASCLIYRKLYL